MPQNGPATEKNGWLEASGLPYIIRTFRMAIHPTRLLSVLAALLLTLLWGWVLDRIWVQAGKGVGAEALDRYVAARQIDQELEPAAGDLGIFEVWRTHERRCLLGLLGSSVPFTSTWAGGSPVGTYVRDFTGPATPLGSVVGMLYGVLWMAREHYFYFLLFGVGTLLIWSFGGGSVCRSAALQFTRDERLGMGAAAQYVSQRWLGGFFLAPLLPIIFVLVIGLLMVIGGMVLRIPVFGDIVAGGAFVLAVIGGFAAALLLLGLLAGGSLLWPTVAAEGSDAFDAFSRSLSYVLSRPWKTVLYACITLVYGSLCWLFVQLLTFVSLKFAHIVVGWGTSFFGATSNKIERIWPISGVHALHTWPDWSTLSWYEYISAFLIGITVLIVVALMWAFLVSFYLSASTIIYFLLRRDVDRIDLEDVYLEEEVPQTPAPPEAT
ncbi:MAG TPA: hypothetical protein PKK06_12400 [Phycisphaerae bacterium]|nr:hypothetical protein [Phycisphaerae bacterium]HNU45478.1 hypothetical protein [Phycisphaerae bacterium]